MKIKATGEVLGIAELEELSAVNACRFRMAVDTAVEGHPVVEVDLSQTAIMDCSGLGALISLSNLAQRRNIRVRLVNPSLVVRQLLELTQTGVRFEIVEVNDEGLNGISRVPGHVLELQARAEVYS